MDKRVESMQVGVDIQERLRRERDEAVRLLRDARNIIDMMEHPEDAEEIDEFLAAVKEEG